MNTVTETFWMSLTATVGRIAAANPDDTNVNRALGAAIDTLEVAYETGHLDDTVRDTATRWFAAVETAGYVAAGPFPIIASGRP
jgi:hypothetical protein